MQTAVDAAVVAGGGAAGQAVVSLNGANQFVITNNSNVQLNLGGADVAYGVRPADRGQPAGSGGCTAAAARWPSTTWAS